MRPFQTTRAGVAGTLLALAVAAVCIRLGVWQLDRREQRVARNQILAERLAAPPLELTTARIDTAGLLYRAVTARGEYDEARSILRAGPSYQGAPGVHVYTPLRLVDGGTVLVNRGWLPAVDPAAVDLDEIREPGTVTVRGFVLAIPGAERGEGDAVPASPAATSSGADAAGGTGARERGALPALRVERQTAALRVDPQPPADAAEDAGFQRVWYRLDFAAIRRQLPYSVPDFYIQALPDSAAPRYPVRLPPPAMDNGPHLGYAIQWFSFAAIALIGWITLAVRQGEVRRARTTPK
ncbi:MAG TPA: SURF1 family protein [Longimicrobiales bacterium]